MCVCVCVCCNVCFLSSYGPSDISIRVGSNTFASGGQRVNVTKIIKHEKFNIGYPYDVAVVKTATPLKLSKLAKPIKPVSYTHLDVYKRQHY